MRMQASMQREDQQMTIYQALSKQHISVMTAQLEAGEAELTEVSHFPHGMSGVLSKLALTQLRPACRSSLGSRQRMQS